eukprot:385464-Hanusia_phi.AAC.4
MDFFLSEDEHGDESSKCKHLEKKVGEAQARESAREVEGARETMDFAKHGGAACKYKSRATMIE